MTTYTDKEQQDFINDIYKKTLGRNAVFGSTFTDKTQLDSGADADYWTNQLQSGTHSRDDLQNILQGSAEYKARDKFIKDYQTNNAGANPLEELIDSNIGPGGVKYATADNPTANLQDQWADNTWLQNFGLGDNFAVKTNDPLADAKSHALAISNQAGTVPGSLITGLTPTNGGDPDGGDGVTTLPVKDGWWNQFEDADAFKKFLQGDATETKSADGMGDFMKFMMLMSVMGGGRGGGGGGYGGSQYGYGGLNPGGVQSAYNPWENMKSGWDFMKNNFGSGSGDVTADNLNVTGTT